MSSGHIVGEYGNSSLSSSCDKALKNCARFPPATVPSTFSFPELSSSHTRATCSFSSCIAKARGSGVCSALLATNPFIRRAASSGELLRIRRRRKTRHSRMEERNAADAAVLSSALSARPSIAAQNAVRMSAIGVDEERAMT